MSQLPHSPDSERVVLSCLLLDGIDAMEQCNRLQPEMFCLDSHQRIYRALCELIEAGAQPDYMVLADMLRKDGALEAIGGYAYLADLNLQAATTLRPVAPRPRRSSKRSGSYCRGLQILAGGIPCSSRPRDRPDETLSRMRADVFDALARELRRR